MSDCCSSSSSCETKPKTQKLACPVCGQAALTVSKQTMLHHIKDVWRHDFHEESYYFCHARECEVVYFSESGETINKTAIRTPIGIKEEDKSALICYCFGVSKAVAETDKQVKEFVVKQTKASMCACDTANPSGRCCLKDFPKFK